MREEKLSQVRERENNCWRSSFLSLGFTAAIGTHSISKEVSGFLLYGFHEENYFCLLSLVIIVVHLILSDNILRSYCLNDKNLTPFPGLLFFFQYWDIS